MGAYTSNVSLADPVLSSSYLGRIAAMLDSYGEQGVSINVKGSDERGSNKVGRFTSIDQAMRFQESLASTDYIFAMTSSDRVEISVMVQQILDTIYGTVSVSADGEEQSDRLATDLANSLNSPGTATFVTEQAIPELVLIDPVASPEPTTSPARPVMERKVRLPTVSLNAESVDSLCQLCAAILGAEQEPVSGRLAVYGVDSAKAKVRIAPTGLVGVRAETRELRSIERVQLSRDYSAPDAFELDVRDGPSGKGYNELNIRSTDRAWINRAVDSITEWASAHRPTWRDTVKFNVANSWPWLAGVAAGLVFPLMMILFLSSKPHVQPSSDQLRSLDEVRANLARSVGYVDKLRDQVRTEQAALELAKKEHKTWGPVLQTDKKALESISQLLASDAQRNRYRDIVFAYVIGVLSSLSATLLFRLKRSRRPSATDYAASSGQ